MACSKCRKEDGYSNGRLFACECDDKFTANIPKEKWISSNGYPTSHRYDIESHRTTKQTEDIKPMDMNWFWGI